jgi:hypothetical protein
LAILETVFKTVTASSNGMTTPSIEEIITTAREKETGNFITPKIQVSVEASGKEVCSMDRANTLKAKISASNASGARADW